MNIFMNTGWTDPGFGETDRFYQNGWIFLWPGETRTLTIDFSSADTYEGGTHMGLTAVQNLDHVTNIGLMVSFPGQDAPDYTWAEADAGSYQVQARHIPEPASLVVWSLLLAGGGRLVWRRRRRNRIKA